MPPSPPSNTLLITDLRRPALFQPAHLAAVRARLAAVAPLNSFAALPALRRIVCSFATAAAAVRARALLETDDGLDLDLRAARIYFGAPTPVAHDDPAAAAAARRLLDAPLADKLFFISPPPSPPHGWVVRNEHPPNKDVHAADLAAALACLDARAPACPAANNPPQTPRSDDDQHNNNNNNSSDDDDDDVSPTGSNTTTLIYHPGAHGCCPTLPAVMVEDTTLLADGMLGVGPVELPHRRILAHTPRPPVELMP